MESQKHRPLGVTIIAILAIISGISSLAAGAVTLIFGIGIVLLAIGIAYLVVAYCLWIGRDWAWMVTLILSVISIISSIATIATGHVEAIISVIIPAVVIYYLYRPNVKAYFGK